MRSTRRKQCSVIQQNIRQLEQQNLTKVQVGQKSGTAGALKDAQDDYARNCQPHSVQGVIYPKYQVVTLVYAPPGCAGTTPTCPSAGSVDYQTGSSSGTKASASQSFKSATQISVEVTLGDPQASSFKAGGSNGFSVTTTDDTSETISKDQTKDMSLQSAEDGVDHNQDVFYLLMNPAVVVAIRGTRTSWNMGYKGKAAALAQITVSQLKTCSLNTNSPFSKLTSTDCSTILKQDPFANGSTAIDNRRFVQTASTYSYVPSSSCIVLQDKIQHERDTDASHTVDSEYTVGYSLDAGASGTPLGFHWE